MSNIEYELNQKIHAIIINPYLKWDDFISNCDLIKKYNIKNISTSLNYLSYLKNAMSNHSVNINALISYPFADLPISFIDEFVGFAKDKGANRIEYMPNFINLSTRNIDTFGLEIEMVKRSAIPVTLIINKTKLDKELFVKAIEISLELGIKSLQFGDGFGPPISAIDVDEILKIISKKSFIKIVGGMKKLSQVIDLFDSGINCVGTSNFSEIFEEVRII